MERMSLKDRFAVRNLQESNIAHPGEQEVDEEDAEEVPRMETVGSHNNESFATRLFLGSVCYSYNIAGEI